MSKDAAGQQTDQAVWVNSRTVAVVVVVAVEVVALAALAGDHCQRGLGMLFQQAGVAVSVGSGDAAAGPSPSTRVPP